MKTVIFKYREVLVEDGDYVEIQDTTLIGPPQLILKQTSEDTYVYLAWAEKVEECER